MVIKDIEKFRKICRQNAIKQWQNKEIREKMKNNVKKAFENPELREKCRQINLGVKRTSEYMEKRWSEQKRKEAGERLSERWKNPEYKKTHSFLGQKNVFYNKKHTLESKEKMKKAKEIFLKENPEYATDIARSGALAASEKIKVKGFKDTKPENEIEQILIKNNIKYIHPYSVKDIKHKYPADFYIENQKLVIEADGVWVHADPRIYKDPNEVVVHEKTAGKIWEVDSTRNQEMKEKGYKVIRMWEGEITEENFINKLKEINLNVDSLEKKGEVKK